MRPFYGFFSRAGCFSAAGFISADLAVGAFVFAAEADIMPLGCQKSAEAEATSSGGLLRSGQNRKSGDSACSTASVFMCWNFLKFSSPMISRRVGFLSKPPREVRKDET